MSLADRSFQTLCLSPIDAGASSGLCNHWDPSEALMVVDHWYVNIYYYPSRTTQLSFTDSSFYVNFFSPIGAGAPSGLSNRTEKFWSDIRKTKYVGNCPFLPIHNRPIVLDWLVLPYRIFSPIGGGAPSEVFNQPRKTGSDAENTF
jgi:hypothetical protein